jgi:predicted ATPase
MLIGREEQIEEICRRAESPGSGGEDANVLFIVGEAGIGKSALLREATARLRGSSRPPLLAVAECSTPLADREIGEVEALQPWGEIIAELPSTDRSGTGETRKLVGELARAWIHCIPVVGDVIESVVDTADILKKRVGEEGAASQSQLFQQYINVLGKLSEKSTVVLAIDDAHWADPSTCNLLFAAARQLRSRPILFIVAYRPDDAAGSRDGEGHPILHIRNELERYSLSEEIILPKMSPGNLDALLRSRYPNYRNDDRFEEWMARISDGNALFITQYLTTLEEDGYIDRAAGTIRDDFEETMVPTSIQAVLRERLRRLDEESSELLRYASVEGEIFTSMVLSVVTELPALKLLQRLRRIEDRSQIVRTLGRQRVYASETTAYQFAHTLMQRLQYESLGDEERQLLHEAVLGVLKNEWELARKERKNIEGVAARLATHAEMLGDNLYAAEVLLAGARSTWEEYAEQETLSLLERAFTALDQEERSSPNAGTDRLRRSGLLLRSMVHRQRGRHLQALEECRAALALFERDGDPRKHVAVLCEEATVLRFLERLDESEASAQRALAEAEKSDYPEGEQHALTQIGHAKLNRGDYHAALEWYERSLSVALRIGSGTEQEAVALYNIAMMHDGLGRPEMALEFYQRVLAIQRGIGNVKGEVYALHNIGVIHMYAGRHAEADECYRQAEAGYRSMGEARGEMMIANNRGVLAMERNDPEDAQRLFERALELARTIEDRRGMGSPLVNLGDLAVKQGKLAEALDLMTESLRIREELNDREGMAISTFHLSMLHIQLGSAIAARELIERTKEMAAEVGYRKLELNALGGLGLVDALEGRQLDGAERKLKYARAIEQIEESIRLLREMGDADAEEWVDELRRVRGEFESGSRSVAGD